MKNLIVMCILVVVLMCAGCQDGSVTGWVFGDEDEMIGGRVGYKVDAIEAGLVSYWWPYGDRAQLWGAYSLYHWDRELLPDTKPYAGLQVGIDLDNDGDFVMPVVGVRFREIFRIECQYTDAYNQLASNTEDGYNIVAGVGYEF